jgi:hypothetical protein
MDAIALVRSIPQRLRVGDPYGGGALVLVPLFDADASPGYTLGQDAMRDGTLTVTEFGGGQVPTLHVHNAGDAPVLLVEGEHLEGARQDRVLNVSVLVSAKSDLPIPVSCVEHGRWGYRSERQRFAPSPEFAHTRLRAAKNVAVAARRRSTGERAADQGAIWAEVERKRAEVGATSPTAAMRDTFEQRGGDLDATIAEFPRPRRGQTGVIVCVGGTPIAMDAFDRPETLSALWPRLARGYAMEALGARRAWVHRSAIASFLERVSHGDASEHDAVGLGTEVAITDRGSVTSALVWGDAAVHLAAFVDPKVRSTRTRPPVERPSRGPSNRSWFRDGDGERG